MAYNIANAAAKVINLAGGTVAAGIDIEGGYFSIDSLSNIPDHAKVLGALCYCTSDTKFYQFNGTNWVEKEFGTKVEASDTNGKIKLDGADTTVYKHASHTEKSNGLYKVTIDSEGHVSSTTAVTKKDITDLGIPEQDTNDNTAHTHEAGTGLALDTTSTGYGAGGIDGKVKYKAKLKTETALTMDATAATTTSGRVYPVAVDKSGYLAVNVPWTDTNTQDGNDNQKIKVDVPNGTDIEFGANDTVEFVAGDNISIEGNKENKTITINATDTVYEHPTHSAATEDLYKVEVDALGHVVKTTKVVKQDITELGIPGQDTTYDLDTSKNSGNGDVKINLTSSDTSSQTDSITIQGSGATTVTTDANGVITISSTDEDTKVTSVDNHYTPTTDDNETISKEAASTTQATWGTTSVVTGVNIMRDAAGHVTDVSLDSIQMPANPDTDTNTAHTHTNGVGLVRTNDGGIDGVVDYKAKLQTETPLTSDAVAATETADRVYPVVVDKSGNLAVNVPWTDTNTQDGNDNQTIKTETVEFGANDPVTIKAGNNVTVEGDAINKTITVSATDTTYDIIDNLTTEDITNPLSANQGVILKALIDALQGKFDSLVPMFVGTHDKYLEKQNEIPIGAVVIILDDITFSSTGVLTFNVPSTIQQDGTLVLEKLPKLTNDGTLYY